MTSKSSENMSQKTAIITGGSRGLGRNTAINLARKGIAVTLMYHSNKTEADSAVADVVGQAGRPSAVRSATRLFSSGLSRTMPPLKPYLRETCF
jgi:NAD(P)-dependent dehydrogenase (short-subunit alcohol dehydrogenase family)